MAQPLGPKNTTCSGNIFFALFGAIALVGILGAGVMTFMKGPLATSVKLTRQNTAENQMNIAGQVAVMASAANGDCETVVDGFVEPVEWRDAGALGHPTNGGLIPLTIGVSKKDPWGTEYGYCGWDHGASNSATDAGCGGAGQKRLAGTNSTVYPVVAMVSAGPDKVFTTTCRTFATADVNADGDLDDAGVDLPLVSKAAETDDDLIFTYTYDEATGASGGLWSLKSGDASTATISKDIEVSGTGTFDRIGATGSDYLEMLSGLKLPGPGVMATCNATNAGVMRLNASGDGIEICDGVSAWNEVTGSGGGSGSGLWLSPNVSSGMDVAAGNPTCVSGTCYGSNVTFTLTNSLDPASASAVLTVTLSNTTDFEKVSDNCHGNSIAAGATCQIVVRAKASGNRSYSAILSITGNNSPLATLDGTASGFGCTIGGNGPGGKYAGCGVGGYDLIVTPSGCTAGTSNPVCAGGADTTTKAGSAIAWSPLKGVGFSSTGQQNTVDEVSYQGGVYSFPATDWCASLQYGGYDDWFLPSGTEASTYLCPNRIALNLLSNIYQTSTSGSLGGTNYWTSVDNNTCAVNNTSTATTAYYIRCTRWDPPRAFSAPTSDTTPVAVTFTPSSSTTAGETRTSNTVTVEGVSAPVTLSVSGGSGAQFSKNGGAYTSTATTVTNGDTVTLRATSPVAGQEDTISATVGTQGFSWKVRTVANNTIYAFVTSATATGAVTLAGADAMCASAASAAGLGGSWIALISSATGDGNGPASRAPWNWTTLKNMNNATVAASFADLFDGTIGAPINRTATNAVSGATYAWVGASDAAGLNASILVTPSNTCVNWTSAAGGNASFQALVNSTTNHFYQSGVGLTCNNSYPVYCIQDPGAGLADTNPADVGLVPGVAFSAGAAALSNTVTVTAILQPVTVTVTPSAGTVDIIVNGVAQGAGPVVVQPNSTLQFSLTVPAVLGTKNTATIAIGDDTYSWWVGYADNSKIARIFVTSTTYSTTSLASLVGADAKCNALAASSSLGLSSDWKAILSDSSTDAGSRLAWNWGTLKDVTGTTIVSGGFPDLWDGSIAAPINKDENGVTRTGNIWTGTQTSGARDTLWSAVQIAPYCTNWTTTMGSGAAYGNSSMTGSTWVYSTGSGSGCSSSSYIYCMENVSGASDTTPNDLSIPYAVQVATSSRQSSSAVVISGMSSGATQTLSVSATGGDPKFTVNGGAEVTSASVTNGDSIVFKMDAPAGANDSNKMTITAGSMTSYWRVWTGWDGGGSGIKRVFVTSTAYNAVIAATADSNCQTRAAAAALGGTWKAIISYVAEANWAVNRIGYNWNELQLVDGTTVVYAPNLWSSSLLSPIIKNESGATAANVYVWTNTRGTGFAMSTVVSDLTCMDWTSLAGGASVSPYVGNTSLQNDYWVARGMANVVASGGCNQNYRLYCIEQ